MTYKSIFYTDTNALGLKTSGKVLCTFGISAAGSKNFRAEVHSTDSLDSSITLANSIKATLNTHYADVTEHTAGAQAAITTANASDLTTLIALVTALLVSYEAHDADAEKGSGWSYHIGQEDGDASLAALTVPTTLAACLIDVNDIKASANTHMAQAAGGTPHADGDTATIATADAATADTNWKVQTSVNDSFWVDTDASVAQIATTAGYAGIVITEGDAETPLRPKGRIITTGAITPSVVAVIMDK